MMTPEPRKTLRQRKRPRVENQKNENKQNDERSDAEVRTHPRPLFLIAVAAMVAFFVFQEGLTDNEIHVVRRARSLDLGDQLGLPRCDPTIIESVCDGESHYLKCYTESLNDETGHLVRQDMPMGAYCQDGVDPVSQKQAILSVHRIPGNVRAPLARRSVEGSLGAPVGEHKVVRERRAAFQCRKGRCPTRRRQHQRYTSKSSSKTTASKVTTVVTFVNSQGIAVTTVTVISAAASTTTTSTSTLEPTPVVTLGRLCDPVSEMSQCVGVTFYERCIPQADGLWTWSQLTRCDQARKCVALKSTVGAAMKVMQCT